MARRTRRAPTTSRALPTKSIRLKHAGCARPCSPSWACWLRAACSRCRPARRCAGPNGQIIGNTPFMDSLLFIDHAVLPDPGHCLWHGRRHVSRTANDVITAVTKTFAGLGGLIFMLLMISQFIAYFNYTNLPSVIAGALAGVLEQASIGALPLLIGCRPGDRRARLHHPRLAAKVGDLRADLRAALHAAGRCRRRRCSPPTASVTRR